MKLSMIALLILLASCGQEEKKEVNTMSLLASPAMAPDALYDAVSDKQAPENSNDLIMKSANVRFQVQNVEASARKIQSLVSVRHALLANENMSTATNQISNRITIRVPSSAFEALLDDLSKESLFVDYKRISSENVTEEYEDIHTRLKTKREVRDRYIEILKTKAKTVEDILKAEEHIRVLQEEIEAKEARLIFLQRNVSMSEIELEIYQKVIYKETPSLMEKPYVSKVTEAMGNGWYLITSLSLFIISGWPVLAAISLIFWFWRRKRRKLIAEASA